MYLRLVPAAVLAALVLVTGAASAADPTLQRIDLGSYVTGPQITTADLRGRVVVVEYWGITCGPCLAAIPHTTELAKQYGHEKLVIVANQVWTATDQQCKDTWEARAKSEYVAVVNGGSVQGFQPRGVPSVVIFDHEGKYLWQGHPGGMDRVLEQAVAAVPDRAAPAEEAAPTAEPIVTDLEVAHFEREVELINQQERPFAKALAKLTREVERETDRATEAAAILAQVDSWVAAQAQTMESAREADPATAYAVAERTAELLRGDDRAEVFVELIKAFGSDRAVMDEVRSMTMLREIEAQAVAIGLNDDVEAARAESGNRRELQSIERALRRVVSVWPETNAGKQAVVLLTAWGFD